LLCGAIWSARAEAADFYVDYESGDDTLDGQSQSSPWQHCPGDAQATGQAASVTLAPGDTVHFRGGVSYRGAIVVGADGADGQPILYDGNSDGSWGDGRALLEGSEPLSGLTPCASAADCGDSPHWQSILRGSIPDGVTPFTANLCEGDELLWIAQEPDQPDPFFYDGIADFFTIAPTQITRTSITDATQFDQSTPTHWDGSFLLIWHQPNLVSMAAITAFVPAENRVTFDDIGHDLYTDRDERYSIFNSLHALDQAGEYYVKNAPETDGTRELYLWPRAATSSDDGSITVSVRPYGFNLAGHSFVTIQGFAIRRYSGDQLTNGVGIGTVSNRVAIQGVVVRDNEVRQVRNPTGGYGGIFVDGCTDCLVEGNTVVEAGRSRGIFVPGAVQTLVRDNVIHKAGATSLTCYGCTDTEFVHNEIRDGTGTHANGITVYLDSHNVTIDGNTVINSNISLTMQASSDITVRNNVFYGGGAGYLVADWGGLSGSIRLLNNTILNSENDASVLFGDDGATYELRNNILDGGGGGERSHNIYTSLTWNQTPGDGWDFAEGESLVEDLSALFVDPAGLDFHLRPDSPAVDAGTDVDVPADLDGYPRPNGAAYDVGAYEYYDEPPGQGGGGGSGTGGSASGGSVPGAERAEDDGGCGCRVAGTKGSWQVGAVALLGWLALIRRGRRRTRRPQIEGSA
jgi:parallel beta-helix repeat protein